MWLESHSPPNTFCSLEYMPTNDFPLAKVEFSTNRLILAIIFPFSSAFEAKFYFLGFSLNAVVVFNAKRAA